MWRSAMQENAALILTIERTINSWNDIYSSQTGELQALATNLKQEVDTLVAQQAQASQKYELVMSEYLTSIVHASQQAQSDIFVASEQRSKDLDFHLQTTWSQLSELLRSQLESVQQAAVRSLETQVADLLSPIHADAHTLSVELHDMKLAAIDVGTDLLSTRHELRTLATSIESLQVSTDSVVYDLIQISEQSHRATQDSQRTVQAVSELEQLTRNRTASIGALLERVLGPRAVMLEAAARALMLYAPDVLKSILVPLVSFGFRGTVSLTAISTLTIGNAALGLIAWVIRLVLRWRANRRRSPPLQIGPPVTPGCTQPPTIDLPPSYEQSESSGFMTPTATRTLPYPKPHSPGFGTGSSICSTHQDQAHTPYYDHLEIKPISSLPAPAYHQARSETASSQVWDDYPLCPPLVAPSEPQGSMGGVAGWLSQVPSYYSSVSEQMEASDVEEFI